MDKKEKYSHIINGITFQMVTREHVWENSKEYILNYIDDITPETQTGRGNLSTLVRIYNQLDNCSYYGFERYLLDMPQYLLIDIFINVCG